MTLAHENKHSVNSLTNLEDSINYIQKHNITNDEDLHQALRTATNIYATTKQLIKVCQNYHMNKIHTNLHKIETDAIIMVNNKPFFNAKSYLEHEMKHIEHNFLKTKEMQKLFTKQQELHQQLTQTRQKSLNGFE